MQNIVRKAQKTLLARLSPDEQKTLLSLLRQMMGMSNDPVAKPVRPRGTRAD